MHLVQSARFIINLFWWKMQFKAWLASYDKSTFIIYAHFNLYVLRLPCIEKSLI